MVEIVNLTYKGVGIMETVKIEIKKVEIKEYYTYNKILEFYEKTQHHIFINGVLAHIDDGCGDYSVECLWTEDYIPILTNILNILNTPFDIFVYENCDKRIKEQIRDFLQNTNT